MTGNVSERILRQSSEENHALIISDDYKEDMKRITRRSRGRRGTHKMKNFNNF